MLPWQAARTLYNILDARWPAAAGLDLVPAITADLARRGPGAARRLRLCLAWLDWEPLIACRARARFWRLPQAARRSAVLRWERSRFPPRRRVFAALAAAVEAALARPGPGAGAN